MDIIFTENHYSILGGRCSLKKKFRGSIICYPMHTPFTLSNFSKLIPMGILQLKENACNEHIIFDCPLNFKNYNFSIFSFHLQIKITFNFFKFKFLYNFFNDLLLFSSSMFIVAL